jgi:hypothetical protein
MTRGDGILASARSLVESEGPRSDSGRREAVQNVLLLCPCFLIPWPPLSVGAARLVGRDHPDQRSAGEVATRNPYGWRAAAILRSGALAPQPSRSVEERQDVESPQASHVMLPGDSR